MTDQNRFSVIAGLFASLLLAMFSAATFAATYSYRADTFSYDTPSTNASTVSWHTTNNAACSTYPKGDDDYADINIASATSPANDFTFTFGGVARTSVRVYSNGMLSFGTDNSGLWRTFSNQALTAAGGISNPGSWSGSCPGNTPGNLIIAYWTDIVAGPADSTGQASVKYELLGTKPNRRFVISWVNVMLYGNSNTRYSFQIILYETPTSGGNSNFKFQYTVGSTTGNPGTVGVYLSSSDYTQYSYNQAYIDPAAGTAVLWYPSTQYVGRRAEYRFDEGVWNGTAGEVKDTANGTENGVRVGLAASSATGKLCRGGYFPADSGTADSGATPTNAVATPDAPGLQGGVDFWYRSTAAWGASGSDAMLIDATSAAAKPFYLMRTAAGALKFALTDSAGVIFTTSTANQSFAANTWVHIGMTWNVHAGTNQLLMKIFVNGVEAQTTSRFTSTPGTIAAPNTFYIGDNRISGVLPSGGTQASANGYLDEVYFYNTEVSPTQVTNDMTATRTSCTSMDHFHITHAGTVINCDVANVTIEAHDINHTQIALAGTQIALSTSTNHGNWQLVTGLGAVTNNGNGSASYTYSNEAVAVFGLTNSYAESTNINVTAGTYTEHSGAAATCVANDYTYNSVCDANLQFNQAGFRFVDASGNNVANQTAALTSGTYYLQAVQNTCTTGTCTGVCSSIFPSGSVVNVDLAYECRDPSSCISGQTLTITSPAGGTAGTILGNASGSVSNASATSTYTTRAVTFSAVSPNPLPAVPFTLNYTDVGKLRLWARYPAGTTSPTLYGTSAEFVVKPAGFKLTEIKPTTATSGRCAVATTPAPTVICSSVASDSAVFAKAGEAFSVTVTAVNNAGNATPNYGKESSTPKESVKLTPTKVVSAMTNVPSIAGSFGSFTSGVATGTAFSWPEVGIITLTPSVFDADYLGAGDVTGTTSGNVGRFIPDHITAVVTEGCQSGTANAYTYSKQPMKLDLSAVNNVEGVTQNYDGTIGFARTVTLTQTGATGSFVPLTAAEIADATKVGKALNSDFSAGLVSKYIAFAFGSVQTVPTKITLGGSDTDSVALVASTDTTKKREANIRSGRLFLANAYGSEFLPLPVTAETQYWDSGWKRNTLDNCSKLTRPTDANLGTTNYGQQLAAGEVVARFNGTTTSTYTVVGGVSKMVLGHPTVATQGPGAGNYGYLDVIGNVVTSTPGTEVATYLLSNWLPPSGNARACFGLCGPKSPVIYMRESY